MNGIFSVIMGSYKSIYIAIASILITVYSFLINRNAKLKSENKSLSDGIEEIKYESERIITIQRKQVEIVSQPTSSRDDIHQQLLDLSRRSKRGSDQAAD